MILDNVARALNKIGELRIGFRSDYDPTNISSTQPWHAWCEKIEVKKDGLLLSVHGNGMTPQEAVFSLVKRYNGEVLVSGAYTDNRKETLFVSYDELCEGVFVLERETSR